VDLVEFLVPEKVQAGQILLMVQQQALLVVVLLVGKMVLMDTQRTQAEAVEVARVMVTQQKQAQQGHLDKVQQVVILASMKAVAVEVVHQPLAQIILMAQAVTVAREQLGKVTQHLQAVAVLVH
jgi:hypothetical protein